MKVNRLKYSIATHPFTLIRLCASMQYHAKAKYSEEERYLSAKKTINKIFKVGKIHVTYDGEENLPIDGGYVMFANHQGKADTLAIIKIHEKPCTVVIDKSVCTNPFLNSCLNVLDAKRLDKTDARQALSVLNAAGEEIIEKGRRYIIFPEGKHDNNQNNLQEFMTGCMVVPFKAKCPIVPVCLYDTYKVYEIPDTKDVACEVHFLEPIYYDEYKDLRKNELAELVKTKIQNKLNELKGSK